MTQGFRFGPGRCCCIKSCEDPTRPICYVDKYATGDNDGTSWADAYTTIQAAINAHGTTHKAYIKGYGKADAYSENVTATDANLTGIDDLWIDGYVRCIGTCCCYNFTLTGNSVYVRSKFDGTMKSTFISCNVDTVSVSGTVYGFWLCGTCTECVANDISGSISAFGFASSGDCTDCFTNNIDGGSAAGFYNCDDCTDCIVDDISGAANAYGFHNCEICTSCVVSDVTGTGDVYGFRSCTAVVSSTCTSPVPDDGCIG